MTMNPTSNHLDDEILSALLDGDATGDAGADRPGGMGGVPSTAAPAAMGSADAAAHLRACDRCAGRQAELAAARSALAAAPVEPLDDLARRRLVAAALAAAEAAPAAEVPAAVTPIGRSRWARRHPALIGSAAAVLLAVLVGVPFVVGNGGSGGDHTLAAQAPVQSSSDSFLGDLGDLSDRDRLRLRLSGASDTYAAAPAEAGPSPAAGSPAAAPLPVASPGGGGFAGTANGLAATTTAPPPAAASRTAGRDTGAGGSTASKAAPESATDSASADQAYASDQSARDRADTDRCVAALLNGPARGGRLTRAGTGTYRGRPAIVASFELSGGTEAFITDRADCAVLERFSV
jgi:hypothetical protein